MPPPLRARQISSGKVSYASIFHARAYFFADRHKTADKTVGTTVDKLSDTFDNYHEYAVSSHRAKRITCLLIKCTVGLAT